MKSGIPSPRILLGPGPSSVTPRVLEALGRAPIGYLDPELFSMLDTLRLNLRTVFGTKNEFTIPLTGTGMAGMECCLSNLIEPGDRAVICVNGFFGARMVELAERLGAEVTRVDAEWGRIIEPEMLASAMKNLSNVKFVGCVHAETSTGVRTPLEPLVHIAHEHNAIFLADTVTSLGGIPVEIDRCGVDVSYSATQKCMGAPPGLAPITVTAETMKRAASRKKLVPNWYYDWQLLQGYYDGSHAYHHTVPINLFFALNESLLEMMEEGLENRYSRHRTVSAQLTDGLIQRGQGLFAQEGFRLPTLNAIKLNDCIPDEVAIRKRLLQEYGVEIGGGLGALKGKVWRIGTMGASATHRNVTLLLGALDSILSKKLE